MRVASGILENGISLHRGEIVASGINSASD